MLPTISDAVCVSAVTIGCLRGVSQQLKWIMDISARNITENHERFHGYVVCLWTDSRSILGASELQFSDGLYADVLF
jgi:hypothetical protein